MAAFTAMPQQEMTIQRDVSPQKKSEDLPNMESISLASESSVEMKSVPEIKPSEPEAAKRPTILDVLKGQTTDGNWTA